MTAEWADAPTDFGSIPAPFKEKNLKKVKFQPGGQTDSQKKDNK